MSEPYLQDADCRLYCGDALEVLRELPDRSVHMCATSPPFYGLRDYQVEGQIGLEESPDEWVARLVEMFREVRRVLRDDGTLWVEIGDSHANDSKWGGATGGKHAAGLHGDSGVGRRRRNTGLKAKDLIGQPWLLAFALRADGWYLRSEIIWARPNPMPESVTDRPTKAHSTVFLLSKSPRYFFDQEAVREPATYFGPNGSAATMDGKNNSRAGEMKSRAGSKSPTRKRNSGGRTDGYTSVAGTAPAPAAGRNIRSVWTIPTEPTPFAHFATWPQKLVQRMILAGTSERGVCPECGAPWVREVEVESSWRSRAENGATRGNLAPQGFVGAGTQRAVHGAGVSHDLDSLKREFIGWRPSCEHDAKPAPATCLDVFAGSGTTLLVARKLGRRSIGIELNPDYCALASERLAQQSLFATEGVA